MIEVERVESKKDWYDVPSNEMTLEQARQAVKDLRKKLTKYLEQKPCEDAISRHDALNCVTFNEVRYRMVEDINALPSVTPKEKSESEHDHEVVKAYNDGQAYILDKIRAEIEDIPNNPITKPVGTYDYVMGATNERRIILEIIDKYRGE